MIGVSDAVTGIDRSNPNGESAILVRDYVRRSNTHLVVVVSRLSLAVQIQIMARGASSGTAKRDPTPKQHGDDDDVESRWSAKRAALAAERRERRLATLETRLLELSEGAEKADDRAGRRLRALLVDLKLAEAEDNERGAPEYTNDARATASSDIEPTRKAKPSPFGGIVRGSDVYATSSSEDEASDSDEGLASFDRGAKSLMHSATLSAARAEAVHAALGRTRAELEEDRVDRQVAARAVADAMAATREAASAEADARRLRQALDVARREHVEASSRASRAEAEASTLRFALRGGKGRSSEEDAEEARRASEQAREECARVRSRRRRRAGARLRDVRRETRRAGERCAGTRERRDRRSQSARGGGRGDGAGGGETFTRGFGIRRASFRIARDEDESLGETVRDARCRVSGATRAASSATRRHSDGHASGRGR